MNFEDILYEIRNGVAWITINRPDKMNAFRGTTCDELIKALDMPTLRSVRTTVLAAFWNAGLDAAPHTEKLIACAVEGSADECFECLTVLEHQEVLPEKAVLKGVRTVSEAIATNTDDYKGAMLGGLLVELKARVGRS